MIAKSEKTLIFAARQQQFCKNRVPDACGKGTLMNWINQTNPFILKSATIIQYTIKGRFMSR